MHYRDIQRALKCGYPKDMQHKLYERKGKCFTKLKQYNNAHKAYKDAVTKVGAANMIEEKKIAFATGTDKLIQQLKDAILKSPNENAPGNHIEAMCYLLSFQKYNLYFPKNLQKCNFHFQRKILTPSKHQCYPQKFLVQIKCFLNFRPV